MILARDFGEKNPSYPRSFKAGRKRVKYCSVSTSWNWAQTPQAKEVKETRPCACSGLQSEKLLSAQSMALPRLMAGWEVMCVPAFPGIPPKGKVTGVFWIAVDYTRYFWPWNMDTQLVLGRPGICYRAGDHGVPKGTLSPKGGASCFLFLMENAVIFNYLKTNDICITVDDFFHDSLFPVLPIECPRWAVAIELPGGVFITQHIVTHNCKWSCKDRDKGKGYQPLEIVSLTWARVAGRAMAKPNTEKKCPASRSNDRKRYLQHSHMLIFLVRMNTNCCFHSGPRKWSPRQVSQCVISWTQGKEPQIYLRAEFGLVLLK